MDVPVIEDNHLIVNCDMPLFDSGTESPVAEDSEESEDSTVCDIEDFKTSGKIRNILDKAISVDEDSLMAPLSPNKCSNSHEKRLLSILRPENRQSSTDSDVVFRRVSFPTDETELACYKESASQYPWIITKALTPDEIVREYQSSCKRHKSVELDNLINQFHEIKNNTNRSATLNLTTITVTREVCETLEDLFKIVNFNKIILNDCKFNLDTIREFLNMLEYYECVTELDIAIDFEDLEIWKLFCNVTAKSLFLQSVCFKSMNIDEQHMRYFLNAVKYNPNIGVLRFDSCALDKLPSFYLIESLMYTYTIRELYLSQTGLYTKEADCLGRFLSKNVHLKILDISNNYIGDRGLESLAKGLTKQNTEGLGLSGLVVFNNQLTEKSGPIIANIIEECKNLHTLNVGFNSLTDFVIECIQHSLGATKSLEGIGFQSTILTCIGVKALSDAIQENCSLKKINLKGNKAIQISGLESLCNALTNSAITQIEIDDTNRSCSDPQKYAEIVKKITAICTVNKQTSDDEAENSKKAVSRKVSLSCEPSYLPPPVSVETCQGGRRITARTPSPSPLCSRFQVSRVQDTARTSRFKVCRVQPEKFGLQSPTEEDEEGGRFLNMRSSLSSNDSLESLPREDEVVLSSPSVDE